MSHFFLTFHPFISTHNLFFFGLRTVCYLFAVCNVQSQKEKFGQRSTWVWSVSVTKATKGFTVKSYWGFLQLPTKIKSITNTFRPSDYRFSFISWHKFRSEVVWLKFEVSSGLWRPGWITVLHRFCIHGPSEPSVFLPAYLLSGDPVLWTHESKIIQILLQFCYI